MTLRSRAKPRVAVAVRPSASSCKISARKPGARRGPFCRIDFFLAREQSFQLREPPRLGAV